MGVRRTPILRQCPGRAVEHVELVHVGTDAAARRRRQDGRPACDERRTGTCRQARHRQRRGTRHAHRSRAEPRIVRRRRARVSCPHLKPVRTGSGRDPRPRAGGAPILTNRPRRSVVDVELVGVRPDSAHRSCGPLSRAFLPPSGTGDRTRGPSRRAVRRPSRCGARRQATHRRPTPTRRSAPRPGTCRVPAPGALPRPRIRGAPILPNAPRRSVVNVELVSVRAQPACVPGGPLHRRPGWRRRFLIGREGGHGQGRWPGRRVRTERAPRVQRGRRSGVACPHLEVCTCRPPAASTSRRRTRSTPGPRSTPRRPTRRTCTSRVRSRPPRSPSTLRDCRPRPTRGSQSRS